MLAEVSSLLRCYAVWGKQFPVFWTIVMPAPSELFIFPSDATQSQHFTVSIIQHYSPAIQPLPNTRLCYKYPSQYTKAQLHVHHLYMKIRVTLYVYWCFQSHATHSVWSFIIWQLVVTLNIDHWMCSELSIWMHSCSCIVAWWWPIFKVRTSCQIINSQKECLVCDWKHQYTFAFRLLPTPLAQYTLFSSPFYK